MKKISVLLALILCFMLLVSCGDTKTPEKTEAKETTATEATTKAEETTKEKTFQLEDVELPFSPDYVNIDAYSFSYYNELGGKCNVRFRMFNNHNLLPASLCNKFFILHTYEEYVDFYDNVLMKAYQDDIYSEVTSLPFAKEEYFEKYFEDVNYNLGVYFWAGESKDGSGSDQMIYPYDVTLETGKITVHSQLIENFHHDQLVACPVPQAMVLIESDSYHEEIEVVIDK